MINETERDKSEFNNAIAYLNRLNFLFYKCGYHSSTLDLNGWFQSLLALYRELSTEIKKEDQTKKETEFQELMSEIMTQQTKGSINALTYWKLHYLELYLRKVTKDAGLQQKLVDLALNALK